MCAIYVLHSERSWSCVKLQPSWVAGSPVCVKHIAPLSTHQMSWKCQTIKEVANWLPCSHFLQHEEIWASGEIGCSVRPPGFLSEALCDLRSCSLCLSAMCKIKIIMLLYLLGVQDVNLLKIHERYQVQENWIANGISEICLWARHSVAW